MLGISQEVLDKVIEPMLVGVEKDLDRELIFYNKTNPDKIIKSVINSNSGIMVVVIDTRSDVKSVKFSNGKHVKIVSTSSGTSSIRGYRCSKISFMK